MKIKDEKGEEMEVFTQAEFDAKSKEVAEAAAAKAVEDFKAANPDKSQEIEALKKSLTDKEQELADAIKSGGNEEQIKRLRQERDDAKKAEQEGVKKLQADLEAFKKEMAGETKDTMLDKLARGDAELRKKIELEFDKYNPSDTSKKGILTRMEAAFKIVTGSAPVPGILDNISNSGDKGGGNGGGGNESKIERTDNEKKIGNILGVSDKDVENYEKYKNENKK